VKIARTKEKDEGLDLRNRKERYTEVELVVTRMMK
jgi:hypothetical protein